MRSACNVTCAEAMDLQGPKLFLYLPWSLPVLGFDLLAAAGSIDGLVITCFPLWPSVIFIPRMYGRKLVGLNSHLYYFFTPPISSTTPLPIPLPFFPPPTLENITTQSKPPQPSPAAAAAAAARPASQGIHHPLPTPQVAAAHTPPSDTAHFPVLLLHILPAVDS